jgi:threonine synthase
MTADGLECTQCGSSCDLQETSVICAECGSLRDLRYDLKRVDQSLNPGSLAERDRGVWRYRDLLPVQQAENIVSLGEGWTPRRQVRRLCRGIWLPESLSQAGLSGPHGLVQGQRLNGPYLKSQGAGREVGRG